MIKIIKSKLTPFLLSILTFIINFGIGKHTHGTEDFIHGIIGFRFLNTLSPVFLNYEPHNSIDFISLPFYQIFGANLITLRFLQAFFLGLSIFFFYLFLEKYFKNRDKALIGSLLLMSIPLYVLTVYHPEFPFLGFFATFVLYLAQSSLKEKNLKIIILLGFIIGLASYRKAIFLPYGIFAITAFLIKEREKLKKVLSKEKIQLFFAGFFAGFLPFFIGNFFRESDGIKEIAQSALSFPSLFVRNIGVRISHFIDIFLSPSWIYDREVKYSNLALLNHLVLFSSFIYLIFKKNKAYLFGVAAIAFTVLSTIQIIEASLILEHLYIIIPLLVIVIVEGVFLFTESIAKSNVKSKIIAILIISGLILINGLNSFHVYKNHFSVPSYTEHIELKIAEAVSDYNFEAVYDLTHPQEDPYWSHILPFYNKVRVSHYMFSTENEKIDKGRFVTPYFGKVTDNANHPDRLTDLLRQTENNDDFLILTAQYSDRKIFDVNIEEKISHSYKSISVPSRIAKNPNLIWVHESKRDLIEKLNRISLGFEE